MTFKEALKEAIRYLEMNNIDEANISAWQLMEFVWQINRSYYFAHADDIIKDKEKEQYMSLIRRRAEHEPLQYITNKAHFMGHTFYVNERVLIPRFDTEVLVEKVGEIVNSGDAVLDMCTGSGCIAIALALDHEALEVTGVDISAEALVVAEKNAEDLEANVCFLESNLFEKVTGKYNIVVSNPPYIRTAVIDELMAEVREYEPVQALDGLEDGLYFYRRIVAQAKDFLLEDGYLVLEIGYDQSREVATMMTQAGYIAVHVIKDLAGLDRVIIGQQSRQVD